MYEDADEGRDVLLTAERIVIFLDKDDDAGGAAAAQLDAGRVRGVYLEDGAVVSDGSTTVRAPRAYYDMKSDRAVLLDAVVWRYDVRLPRAAVHAGRGDPADLGRLVQRRGRDLHDQRVRQAAPFHRREPNHAAADPSWRTAKPSNGSRPRA